MYELSYQYHCDEVLLFLLFVYSVSFFYLFLSIATHRTRFRLRRRRRLSNVMLLLSYWKSFISLLRNEGVRFFELLFVYINSLVPSLKKRKNFQESLNHIILLYFHSFLL